MVCYTGLNQEFCTRDIIILISLVIFFNCAIKVNRPIYYRFPINLIAIRVLLHYFSFFKFRRIYFLMRIGMFRYSSLFPEYMIYGEVIS